MLHTYFPVLNSFMHLPLHVYNTASMFDGSPSHTLVVISDLVYLYTYSIGNSIKVVELSLGFPSLGFTTCNRSSARLRRPEELLALTLKPRLTPHPSPFPIISLF